MRISVIIPVYNEEKTIIKMKNSIKPFKDKCEIIFVDGGSTDKTKSLLSSEFKVINSQKGRANQMNQGATVSTGEVLFFLHCDSYLPKSSLKQIEEVMKKSKVGYFGIKFDSQNLLMKCCGFMSNLRAKISGVVFGDQGIFIERNLFFDVGMFPDLAVMEDYQFSLNLKKMGIRQAQTSERICTSDRRFGKNNVQRIKVMLHMQRLRFLYRKGIPASKIARMYKDVR